MAEIRNNTIQYPGYFLMTQNGTLLTPFHHNVYFGSFLQLLLLSVFSNCFDWGPFQRDPSFSGPRKIIFLLGVIFSSLLAFALSSMDITYVFFVPIQKDTEFCEAYIAVSGIPPRLMQAATFISIFRSVIKIFKRLQFIILLI